MGHNSLTFARPSGSYKWDTVRIECSVTKAVLKFLIFANRGLACLEMGVPDKRIPEESSQNFSHLAFYLPLLKRLIKKNKSLGNMGRLCPKFDLREEQPIRSREMVQCSSAQLPLRDLPSKHGREPFSSAADVGWLCLCCWKTGVINSIWATFLPSFRQNLRISGIQPWESDSRGTTLSSFLQGRKLTLPGHWPQACVHFMCFSTLRKTTIRCCLPVFNTQRRANMLGSECLKNKISERKKNPNQLWHHLGKLELVWKWVEFLFTSPHMITLQKNNTSAKKKKKKRSKPTQILHFVEANLPLLYNYVWPGWALQPSSCLPLPCSTRARDIGSWV